MCKMVAPQHFEHRFCDDPSLSDGTIVGGRLKDHYEVRDGCDVVRIGESSPKVLGRLRVDCTVNKSLVPFWMRSTLKQKPGGCTIVLVQCPECLFSWRGIYECPAERNVNVKLLSSQETINIRLGYLRKCPRLHVK